MSANKMADFDVNQSRLWTSRFSSILRGMQKGTAKCTASKSFFWKFSLWEFIVLSYDRCNWSNFIIVGHPLPFRVRYVVFMLNSVSRKRCFSLFIIKMIFHYNPFKVSHTTEPKLKFIWTNSFPTLILAAFRPFKVLSCFAVNLIMSSG